MIFLSEDALKYLKRYYMKNCIKLILIGAGVYTIINKIIDQEIRIDNLTKQVEELNLKGD